MVEFTYNNNYQDSLEMVPYEAPYERSCRSPLFWVEPDEQVVMGPQFIEQTTKKVCMIRDRLKAVHSRQKKYVGLHRKEVEFNR